MSQNTDHGRTDVISLKFCHAFNHCNVTGLNYPDFKTPEDWVEHNLEYHGMAKPVTCYLCEKPVELAPDTPLFNVPDGTRRPVHQHCLDQAMEFSNDVMDMLEVSGYLDS